MVPRIFTRDLRKVYDQLPSFIPGVIMPDSS
jgi:hypothetical protein